jgi:hypothetical protein
MKKLIMTLLAVQIVCIVNAQWYNKTVDNDFDPIYRVSYTEEYHSVDLRMQNVENRVSLYLTGDFWCEDAPIIELSFLIRQERVYHELQGTTIGEFKNVLIVSSDLERSDFFEDLKHSKELKLIIHQKDCPNQFYKYDMTGINQAIRFLKSEYVKK